MMRLESKGLLLFIAGYRVGQRAGDGFVHLDRRVLRRSRQNCPLVQRHRDVLRDESSTLELNKVAMTTGHSVPDTVLRDTVSVFPGELAATRLTVLLVGYVVAGELHKKISVVKGIAGVHTRVLFCGLSAESFTI